MWSLWSCERGDNIVETDLHNFVIERIVSAGAPEPLCLCIRLNQFDLRALATGHTEVVEGDLVDWEEGGGCTKLWRHVGDRCAVGE